MMAENTKKRSNSFRKYFPSIFFKSRDKNNTKDLKSAGKIESVKTTRSNKYENPQSTHLASNGNAGGLTQRNDDDISERIYENLSTQPVRVDRPERISNEEDSKCSSSSTLVSVNTGQRNKTYTKTTSSDLYTASSLARPQVPPKPQHENIKLSPGNGNGKYRKSDLSSSDYPDVYYHSLEKLSDKITSSPIDKAELNNSSQSRATPASVSAEIKKVSTTFIISPKKEAEVRTIQPKRARSFSLEKETYCEVVNKGNDNIQIKENHAKKAYIYSAPTSPTPTNHKIPNTPATVSPYGSVRKSINEAEEKKNSLNRLTTGRQVALSTPTSVHSSANSVTYASSTELMEPLKISQKEKTRQKVEAFYWHKLKELKVKEDDYLWKQSLNATHGSPCDSISYLGAPDSSSSPRVLEPRSCSLPRTVNLKAYDMNQPTYTYYTPFVRGTPERKTDTSIKPRKSCINDQEIVYRHSEKLLTVDYATVNKSMGARQSPGIQQDLSGYQVPKRVSFEDDLSRPVDLTKCYVKTSGNSGPRKDTRLSISETPPKPPLRLSSVGCANKIHNRKIITSERKLIAPRVINSIYSESESGSEAGEIQRILQNVDRKGESINFLISIFI